MVITKIFMPFQANSREALLTFVYFSEIKLCSFIRCAFLLRALLTKTQVSNEISKNLNLDGFFCWCENNLQPTAPTTKLYLWQSVYSLVINLQSLI